MYVPCITAHISRLHHDHREYMPARQQINTMLCLQCCTAVTCDLPMCARNIATHVCGSSCCRSHLHIYAYPCTDSHVFLSVGAILVLGRDLVMVPKLIHPLPPNMPGTPKSPAYGEPIEEEPPTPHPMTDTWMQVMSEQTRHCQATVSQQMQQVHFHASHGDIAWSSWLLRLL